MTVSSFGATITGTRYTTGGSYNALGDWVDGTTEAIDFKGSIQPLKGDEMLSLPEGRRNHKSFRIYSREKLFTGQEPTVTSPDLIDIDGEIYEVVRVERWQNGVISHWKSFVTLKND